MFTASLSRNHGLLGLSVDRSDTNCVVIRAPGTVTVVVDESRHGGSFLGGAFFGELAVVFG